MNPFVIYEAVEPGSQAAGGNQEATSHGHFYKESDAKEALRKRGLQNWGTVKQHWAIKTGDGKMYLLKSANPFNQGLIS